MKPGQSHPLIFRFLLGSREILLSGFTCAEVIHRARVAHGSGVTFTGIKTAIPCRGERYVSTLDDVRGCSRVDSSTHNL